MAGDWIKMEINLHEKPEVIRIASAIGKSRFDVVGRLHRLWSWFDSHTSNGHAKSVTSVTLDEVVSCDGFASALLESGWLVEDGEGVSLPKFDRHNGKSAKSRAYASERQKLSRSNRDKCHTKSVTEALPEKRREEKREEPLLSPSGGESKSVRRPTLEQAQSAGSAIGISRKAVSVWWHKREASEWMKGTAGGGTTPVGSNWQADLTASKTWAEDEAKKSPESPTKKVFFDP